MFVSGVQHGDSVVFFFKVSFFLHQHFILFYFLVLPLYCYQAISLHPRAHMLCHVTPWTSARQTPLSMDFSRQESWSGLPTFYFFFFWLDWVFLALCGLSLVAVGGGGWAATLCCASQTSHCGDFSYCRAQTLGMGFTGSVFVVHRLNCLVACGIFLEQESNPCPLLMQADSSTVPPGKSMIQFYIFFYFSDYFPLQFFARY